MQAYLAAAQKFLGFSPSLLVLPVCFVGVLVVLFWDRIAEAVRQAKMRAEVARDPKSEAKLAENVATTSIVGASASERSGFVEFYAFNPAAPRERMIDQAHGALRLLDASLGALGADREARDKLFLSSVKLIRGVGAETKEEPKP